jgi:hypothetical protein
MAEKEHWSWQHITSATVILSKDISSTVILSTIGMCSLDVLRERKWFVLRCEFVMWYSSKVFSYIFDKMSR